MKKIKLSKKQVIISVAVMIGMLVTIIMSVYKKSLGQFNLVKKIVQYKRLVSDGMKDFFEVQELNLRLDRSRETLKNNNNNVRVLWDSDNSNGYILIISSEYISKMAVMNSDTIQELKNDEDFSNQMSWIRKVILNDTNTLQYDIPFDRFQCRIKSEKGRVSRLLKYPTRRQTRKEKKEIQAWVSKIGRQYFISIEESKDSATGKIYEYQIILYINDGKGVVRTVPPFKDSIRLCLGELPPCLCYIKAIRNIGIPIEQFICWIKEDEAMKINLDEFNLQSSDDNDDNDITLNDNTSISKSTD